MKEGNIFSELREEYNQSHDTRITQKELSVIFISKGYSSLTHEKIRKIETDQIKRLKLDEYIAFSDFYNVSVDYLLGLTKAKSKDEDMKMICDTTGLSEESVKNLKDMKITRLLPAGLGIAELNIIDLICNDIKELQSFERMMTEYIKLEYSIQEQSVPTIPVYRTKDEYNNIEYHSDFIADSDRYSSILFLSDTPSGHSKIRINITPQLLKTNIEEQIRLWADRLGHTYYKNNKNIDNQRKDK